MPDKINSKYISEPLPIKTPSKASKKKTTKQIEQEDLPKKIRKVKQKDLLEPLAV
jgi:hypothetical protein